MKRPTWATVVGVLGIIFSCFGILGAGQEIIMPKMMKFQKEIFTHTEERMHKEVEKKKEKQMHGDSRSQPLERDRENNAEFPIAMFKLMEKMWDYPEWYGVFSVICGILKAIISGFYLFASICLLQMKPFSIRLFYWAAGSSISFAVIKGIFAVAAISFIMGMTIVFGGMFGIIIDIVLIIVVATGNKDAFDIKTPLPLPQKI